MARLDQSDVRSGLAGDVDDPGRGAQDEGAGDDGDHAEPQVVGSDTRPLANPAPRQHARHAPPGQVGRFAILQRLGAGGMGVVYSAYDETLDRKVAVKVLRADARGGTKARDRLLREAQVMARLSHPNLVTVHEIGSHEGQVFIAMEFVRGQSLDQWITREPPRAWREVLAVFRQAGEALMAVHSAGLLHRDFKPHNAILGDDGVVKVLDFGLARALDARDSEVEDSSEAPSGSSGGMLAASLTRTGAILGTPAYMAPEQQSGRAATTRTDQFNFCASLYEALFGQLPFPTSSREVLVDAVMNGRVREPPASVHVPKWVRRVVARGLSAEPEARHPSMEALLRALDRDPAIRWRRRLGAAAIAGLSVLGGYGLFALGTERVGDCEGIERELAGVWSDARRDSVKAGLLASGSANAAETWERVERELDAYADAWSRLRAEGCEAHRDGRDAETIYARSVACLASRRASLSALVEVLESADDGVVENAVAAAAQLPELARCGDAAALLAAVSPPEDPDAAAIERAQRERLARAAVLESAGRYDEALGLALTARASAEDIEFPPLTAAAELRRGSVSIFLRDAAAAEEALSNALWLGLRYGDDRVANEAVARRIFVRTELLGDSGAGLVDEPLARALAFRVDADWRLRWIIDNNLGVAYERSGAWERAESLYRAALDQAMRRGSAGALEAIAASINVAGLVEEQGGYLEAIAVLRRTAGFVERWLGDHHPMMTGVRIPLARNLQRSGRHREAAEVLDACEEARRAVPNPLVGFEWAARADLALALRQYDDAIEYGRRSAAEAEARAVPESLYLTEVVPVLADALMGRGSFSDGIVQYERALQRAAERLGADDRETIALLVRYGDALRRTGQLEEALTHLQRALTLYERGDGVEGPPTAEALIALAACHRARGEDERAWLALARARELLESHARPASPMLIGVYLPLASLLEARGEFDDAEELLRAALSIREGADADDPALASLRFALARIVGRPSAPLEDHAEATQLAAQAERTYAGLGLAWSAERRAVQGWLAAR